MKRKQLDDNCLYFDITKQERDSAIRYLLGAIIKVRDEGDFPSNYYIFDEDVNIYLAHLLFAVSLPEYHEMAEPYLSTESSDILRWVRATEDRTVRYFIFKVNADHLLVHSAVFNDLEKRKPHKFFRKNHKHYRELAKLYYDQATAYHRKIYRKRTGVGEVLGKLSHYYQWYQEILKQVRREYFHFVNRFRDEAFDHFMDQVSNYENDFQKKVKLDHFLDLYGRWLDTKDPVLRKEIQKLVYDLKALDKRFRFDLEQLGDGGFDHEKKCA
ncbi:MAG: hypothetical protein Q8R76_03090 [Candidatus Omnitrophota bacterium]|nr:hypothetical protein [Candidatus Omnitrophota bacterium]